MAHVLNTQSLVTRRIREIQGLDGAIMKQVQSRLDQLIKPVGSLSSLEDLAKQYAGATRQIQPALPKKAMLIMVGDHGVVEEGINAYPQAVTVAMVQQFIQSRSAICILARQAGAELKVVDVGIKAELDSAWPIIHAKVAPGTANMALGPAMTEEQLNQALAVGMKAADELIDQGITVLGLGEMGIGNTTPSSALTAVLTNAPVDQVVGHGSGLNQAGVAHKIAVIKQAIAVNSPDPQNPLEVLRKLGGLEIAALTGAIFAAAARKTLIALDGFVTSAAALVAYQVCPTVAQYLIPSHLALEPGHRVNLAAMKLHPLLRLKMNLGEGAGAPFGMMLLDAGLKILNNMATFNEAQVAYALQDLSVS